MSANERELWCPVCDVPADECVQPEGEEQDNGDGAWMEVYWVEGHSAQWETLAERARDEVIETYRAHKSAEADAPLSSA